RWKDDLWVAVREPGLDELVAVVERDGADASDVRALERVEAGLLDLAELRRKHDRPLRVELSHRDHVEDTLPGLESRKEVHDRFPLRVPAADRGAVGLEPVALALARERSEEHTS